MKKKYSEAELIEQEKAMLAEHLPNRSVDYIHSLFKKYPCNFKIVPPRKGKLGDCRYPMYNQEAQITVNGNLSKLQFLITTIHEFAHLKTFLDKGKRVTPHGAEWKANYVLLFQPVINSELIEQSEIEVIKKHLSSPSATSCNDEYLSEYFHAEKHENDESTLLKNIPSGAHFEFNGRLFIKGNLVQKKFIIYDADNHRDYRLSGLANVSLLKSATENQPKNNQLSLFESLLPQKPKIKTLASLEVGMRFKYDGHYFTVVEKKRTRYICQLEKSKRQFSMHQDIPINL
jgi:SprT protein